MSGFPERVEWYFMGKFGKEIGEVLVIFNCFGVGFGDGDESWCSKMFDNSINKLIDMLTLYLDSNWKDLWEIGMYKLFKIFD